jgi:hypothetical protein
MAFSYPILASITLVVLYFFSRAYLDDRQAYLAPILYLTCSNFLLIPLFLDQVLYPLLFISCTFFILKIIQSQSFICALLCGLVITISLFFSFSFLPLIGLAPAWVILQAVTNPAAWRGKTVIKLFLGLGAGLIFGYLIFRLCLQYDFFTRYLHAFARHQEIKTFQPGIQNLLSMLLVNNVDIAAWSGFPLFILFVAQIISSIISMVHGKANKWDVFSVAIALTYGGLNIFSQTRGEVGRIWLFMVPFFALLAAGRIVKLSPSWRTSVTLLILLQLVTAFMTFQFQDFFA